MPVPQSGLKPSPEMEHAPPFHGVTRLRAHLNRLLHPENWTLSARFLYTTGGMLAVGGVILVLIFSYYQNLILAESVNSRLTVFEQWMQDKLSSQQDLLYSEVVPLTSMPEVVGSMRSGDRERLKRFILPYMERIRAVSGMDTFYYHFHLPPAISFLRTWDLENTGSDLSDIRPMVVKANKYLTPLKGAEVGPGGAVLRAIVPVSEQGVHLGTVEVAASIEGILQLTQMPTQFGVMLLLDNRFGDTILPNHPMPAHGRWLLGKNLHAGNDTELAASLSQGAIPSRLGNIFYRFMRLDDFQGQTIGGLLLAYDSGPLTDSLLNESVIFGLAFACGAITLMFALYANVKRVKQFLRRFQRVLVATNDGNFSQRFETEPVHCLEVLRCGKKDCPVYKNPALICYMETGSEAISPEHRGTCVFLAQYRKCSNCPVHALRHGDELVEMRNAVNTMMRIWGNFATKVNHVIAGVLHSRETAEHIPSLSHITGTLEHMAGLTTFSHDMQGVVGKEEVYRMLENVILKNFKLSRFALFETTLAGNMTPVVDRMQSPLHLCGEVISSPGLCRANRTGQEVCSHSNAALCPYFHVDGDDVRCCLPIVMGGKVGGVASFVIPAEAWERHRVSMSIIQCYLNECAPVLSTLQLLQISKENALRDSLTGVNNRRFLDEYIKKYEAVAIRDGKMVGFIMVDVDFFKQLNDQYGHLAGDQVLKELASLLQQSVRQADLVVRFGGEEFLVLLHEVQGGHTAGVAEKIRQAVENHPFILPDGTIVHKTISLGIAEFPADADMFYKAIKFADVALYRAKETGRNKVVAFRSEMWVEQAY